jgi:hypothetical protein
MRSFAHPRTSDLQSLVDLLTFSRFTILLLLPPLTVAPCSVTAYMYCPSSRGQKKIGPASMQRDENQQNPAEHAPRSTATNRPTVHHAKRVQENPASTNRPTVRLSYQQPPFSLGTNQPQPGSTFLSEQSDCSLVLSAATLFSRNKPATTRQYFPLGTISIISHQ